VTEYWIVDPEAIEYASIDGTATGSVARQSSRASTAMC
jgi:hypothetical protein